MAETWCGKSCVGCAQKEQLNCPGCKAGPGRPWSSDCEISVCCRNKNHDSCDTCNNNRYCGKRSHKDDMPQRRARELAAQEARRAEMARLAPFMGKWLWLLFWMVVPSTIVSILSMDALSSVAPQVCRVGKYLGVACSVIYGLIMLQLSKEKKCYKSAGILRLVTAVVSLLLVLVSGAGSQTNWSLLITLPGGVVGLVATYQEYMAHADALKEVDADQSEKWRLLWKWYIGLFVGMFGCLVVMIIVPLLGLLLLLAVLIGETVAGIVSIVYTYRTAQAFRTYR